MNRLRAAAMRALGGGRLPKYLGLAIVVMFLLLVLLDKVIMPWYVKLGAVETVPGVIGLTFAEPSGEARSSR